MLLEAVQQRPSYVNKYVSFHIYAWCNFYLPKLSSVLLGFKANTINFVNTSGEEASKTSREIPPFPPSSTGWKKRSTKKCKSDGYRKEKLMTDPPPRVAMCFFQLQLIGQGLQMSLAGFLLSSTCGCFCSLTAVSDDQIITGRTDGWCGTRLANQ